MLLLIIAVFLTWSVAINNVLMRLASGDEINLPQSLRMSSSRSATFEHLRQLR